MSDIRAHQEQLLNLIKANSAAATGFPPLSEAVEAAYYAVPRHHFIRRYRLTGNPEWHEVGEDNLDQHLINLYQNRPLILVGDRDADVASTISQPGLVLHMIDLLQVGPGQRVFEVGAGSGWNAGLMGHVVGPEGRVVSSEIITELAAQAQARIAETGLDHVEVVAGDGADGPPDADTFDRIMFTVGSYDVPAAMFERLRDDGLMLMVLKNPGGFDSLQLLRKRGDHLESELSLGVGFVPLSGKHHMSELDPIYLPDDPDFGPLEDRVVERRPYFWGAKGQDSFGMRTALARIFLALAEPTFATFKPTRDANVNAPGTYFGLFDREAGSLVTARPDELVSYGSTAARERLLSRLHEWIDLGMPGPLTLKLRVYPIDADVEPGEGQYLVKRRESQLLWWS